MELNPGAELRLWIVTFYGFRVNGVLRTEMLSCFYVIVLEADKPCCFWCHSDTSNDASDIFFVWLIVLWESYLAFFFFLFFCPTFLPLFDSLGKLRSRARQPWYIFGQPINPGWQTIMRFFLVDQDHFGGLKEIHGLLSKNLLKITFFIWWCVAPSVSFDSREEHHTDWWQIDSLHSPNLYRIFQSHLCQILLFFSDYLN